MSFKKPMLRVSTLGCVFGLLAACSASPEKPGGDWTENGAAQSAPLSFEEYREIARQTLEGRDVFIVEGDMLFDTEDALKSHYDSLHVELADKSIINKVNGVADSRPNPTNIRYCFVAGWGVNNGTYTAPALAAVRTNIQAAMANWESVTNVKFVYMSNLDGAACNTSGANPGVDFVVTHWNNANTAIGPFPSNAWANQQLKVPTSGIPRLLALHELGHALGYRHEHIHTGANPRCDEGGDRIELTSFDTASVMKYNNCTQSMVINGTELSALDATGAHKIYGPTTSNSLYIVQDGGLWRADNDDGVYKQANAADWSGASSTATLGSFFYVIQNSHLHKVNPVDGSFTVLGGAAWPGTTAMAALNGSLYIQQDAGIGKITNLNTGAFSLVSDASDDWSEATSMAAHNGALYVIQASHLHQFNPADGSYTLLGGPAWPGVTTMASVGGNLYVTQDDGIWKITNLSTGAFARVSAPNVDWTDATSMTALDGRLYIVQASHLHRVNPADGSYTVLGGAAWPGLTVMTAMP